MRPRVALLVRWQALLPGVLIHGSFGCGWTLGRYTCMCSYVCGPYGSIYIYMCMYDCYMHVHLVHTCTYMCTRALFHVHVWCLYAYSYTVCMHVHVSTCCAVHMSAPISYVCMLYACTSSAYMCIYVYMCLFHVLVLLSICMLLYRMHVCFVG